MARIGGGCRAKKPSTGAPKSARRGTGAAARRVRDEALRFAVGGAFRVERRRGARLGSRVVFTAG
jgi:hypothetical protein